MSRTGWDKTKSLPQTVRPSCEIRTISTLTQLLENWRYTKTKPINARYKSLTETFKTTPNSHYKGHIKLKFETLSPKRKTWNPTPLFWFFGKGDYNYLLGNDSNRFLERKVRDDKWIYVKISPLDKDSNSFSNNQK